MRMFVTGGAGFIGSRFVRDVIGGAYPAFADAHITVFDKLTYAGNLENLAPVADSPRLQFVRGDICSASDLDQAMPGHDVVVNFAAETHVDRSIVGAAEFIQTNVFGAQQVFEAALRHDVRRVVHISTDEVYGSIEQGSWREDTLLEPNSPYSAAKASSDLIARAYAKSYGLDISITRCSNNYGPYHFPEKVIPLFVTNLLDGLKVPLYGVGANVRDWLFVGDHCRGIALVVERVSRGSSTTSAVARNCPTANSPRRCSRRPVETGPTSPRSSIPAAADTICDIQLITARRRHSDTHRRWASTRDWKRPFAGIATIERGGNRSRSAPR
jgi:dTDP-glucose 4,6-dehydratase